MTKFHNLCKNVYHFCKETSVHNSATYASSVAFFFFLSIFPTLMLFSSLIPYLPVTEKDLIDIVTQISPDGLNDYLIKTIDNVYQYASTLLPITAVVTLWTAGMGIMGLIRAFNGIFEVEDRRNYFILRGIATLYTFIMLIAVIVSMILALAGRIVADKLTEMLPQIGKLIEFVAYLRGFFMIGIMIVILDFAYTFLPAERQRLIYNLPGAVFAAFAWCVMTWGFSLYIDLLGNISIYGNLMTIMMFLFWLYSCFTVVIIGAFMNKYYKPLYAEGLKMVNIYIRKRKNRKIKK